jgi:hypothetical protein
MQTMSDFEKRFSALKREVAGKNEWDRCEAFKAFHLEWGAALEASDPHGAMTQYSLAEDCQWTIGTFSTAGGEGLASMSEVYRIMGLRADILERQLRFGDALELWERIQADPNGLGTLTPAAAKIKQLKARIGR